MAKGHDGGDLPPMTWFNGQWHDQPIATLGPHNHAVWMSSVVFDGARFFDGVAPDLDLHCGRVVRSARLMGMDPMLSGGEIVDLAWEGIHRFPRGHDLYICPMFYTENGFLLADPQSTRFTMVIMAAPLPEPTGFTACLSSYRRPAIDMAPTEAKASCLYPNVSRCVQEARDKGFDTSVVKDAIGNVAEFAYTNLFYAKDGVVFTPAASGAFLNGLTRQRVIALLQGDGVEVRECAVRVDDLLQADEIFATGNFAKVQPCVRLEERTLEIGPLFQRARDLYMRFAKDGGGH